MKIEYKLFLWPSCNSKALCEEQIWRFAIGHKTRAFFIYSCSLCGRPRREMWIHRKVYSKCHGTMSSTSAKSYKNLMFVLDNKLNWFVEVDIWEGFLFRFAQGYPKIVQCSLTGKLVLIYRVSQEERSIILEVILSAILKKKCKYTCVLFRTVSEIELFHCTVFFLFGLWGYWHGGHSWPIVPASGDSED
jgi:hypothetical protein